MSQETELHLIDKLCGINRDRDVSNDYGKVVCPIIWLWDSPFRTKVIAVAEHDEVVEILERLLFEPDGRYYYRVQPARAVFVGRLRRFRGWLLRHKPSGWVPAPFLKKVGARGYEVSAPYDWGMKVQIPD